MIKAYRKFTLELGHIERLYIGTMYAFDSAIKSAADEVASGKRDPSEPFQRKLADFYANDQIANNAVSFRKRFKSVFPQHLHEILFVRIISILEVFLVDCVQEVFLARQDLFRRDDRLEIPYSQLLSFESIADVSTYLINRESSALRNGSFQDTTKYYARRFGIDLKELAQDYTSLLEYHDRRHLLVHRLGYTDPKYRRDYNTNIKRVIVDRRYLLKAFLSIQDFASKVAQSVTDLAESTDMGKRIAEPSSICILTIQLFTPRGKLPIAPSFNFACDDKVVTAKDILHSQVQGANDDIWILELRGKIKQVDAYLAEIKRFGKSGDLKIIELKFHRRLGLKSRLSRGFIAQFKEMFPDEKMTTEVRDEVARRFGISKRQARRIMLVAYSHISKEMADEVFEFLKQAEPLMLNVHEVVAEKFSLTELQAKAAIRQYLKLKNSELPSTHEAG